MSERAIETKIDIYEEKNFVSLLWQKKCVIIFISDME